jgi:tetratricopeptide (TPR) repeat protein
MVGRPWRSLGAALAFLAAFALASSPATASVCFTSGKVYMQQKVWDKAATQLECARKLEPQNSQVYLLLGSARSELFQYASAGAAFELGITAAKAKKDDKKAAEIKNNQMAYMSRLYNLGVKAMTQAGNSIDPAAESAGIDSAFGLFGLPKDPNVAIVDSTAYPKYDGSSHVQEAVYYFRLATLVAPKEADPYRNLAYLYDLLGRSDDAMAAARAGLAIAPNDDKLQKNLRAAAVGNANRLYNAEKYPEAIDAYTLAIANDPSGKLVYESRIADARYRMANKMGEKDPGRGAMFDSTVAAYNVLLRDTPAESTQIRENAYYNQAVILANQSKNKEAAAILDQAVKEFPHSKDLLFLAGQTKYNASDFTGAADLLKRALAEDPKDAAIHQALFQTLTKLNKQNESVAEYTLYKALGEGKARTGSALKTWVDTAENRYGPGHALKKTLASEGGYPDEVRTYNDGDKRLESWFYWTKGKAITFMEGQVLSQATFPPTKS